MDNILFTLFLTISIATILNIILKKFGVSHIIGYIITGTMISYIFNFNGLDIGSLELIAEFGIVFLMFTIGLEMKLENLIQMRKQVFTYGGLQVGLSIFFFTFISYFLFLAM